MIRQTAKLVAEKWNRFFFEPISPASIGLFRIVFGVVIFVRLLGIFPYREIFYSDAGIVSFETMSHFFPPFLPGWLYFRWIPESEPWLMIYFLGLMACAVSLTLGFFTRISSCLVWLGMVSLSNRNFFADNGGDHLMRINCFFLIFSEAGAAFSIDRWRRVRKGWEGAELPRKSPWGQRALQLQLSYLYLDTFYLKLPGWGWRDGTALYYALNYLELRRFSFKYVFYYLWQIKLATYSTEVVELFAGSLVWFRRLRYPILVATALLHLGINLTMQFPIFQYVMLASLINFVYPEHLERTINAMRQRLGGRPTLGSEPRAAA